jgi:hypothetical protein
MHCTFWICLHIHNIVELKASDAEIQKISKNKGLSYSAALFEYKLCFIII